MTAKTLDDKVFYTNEKIYMPIPQQLGRGQKMGQGPYEKSGLIHDSALPPRKTTKESFMIPVYTESEEEGKLIRTQIAQDFVVEVEIWYLPYGKKDDSGNAQKWFSVTKKLHLPADEK